jgi:putative endonuclease
MSRTFARSLADLSSRWRNRFSRLTLRRVDQTRQSGRRLAVESSDRRQLGVRGEKLACGFLRRQGYKILYRNFRARHGGEVDIICRDGETLVFVEVKTRRHDDLARPSESINAAKRKLISRGALAWLQLLDNPDILSRFDVVEIVLVEDEEPRFELIRNAFELSKPYIY